MMEQAAMTVDIGIKEFVLKKLTKKDAEDPIIICKKPIIAEALPALFEKGVNDKADALGKVNP